MSDRLKNLDIKDPRVLLPFATAIGVPAVALLHYIRRGSESSDHLTQILSGVNSLIQVSGRNLDDFPGHGQFITHNVEQRYETREVIGIARLGKDLSGLRSRINYLRDHRAELHDVAQEYGIREPEVVDSAARKLDTMGGTIAPFVRLAIRRSLINDGVSVREIAPGDEMFGEVISLMEDEWPVQGERILRGALHADPRSVRRLIAVRDGTLLGCATLARDPNVDLNNFEPGVVAFPDELNDFKDSQGVALVLGRAYQPSDDGITAVAAISLGVADFGRRYGVPVVDPYFSKTAWRKAMRKGVPYSELWRSQHPDGSHTDIGRNVQSIFAVGELGATDRFITVRGHSGRPQGRSLRYNGHEWSYDVPAGFMLMYDPDSQDQDIEVDFSLLTE